MTTRAGKGYFTRTDGDYGVGELVRRLHDDVDDEGAAGETQLAALSIGYGWAPATL